MKNSLTFGALCAAVALLGAVAPVRADEAEKPFTLQERRAVLLPQPTGNGYDDLISAYLARDSDAASPAMMLDDETPEEKQQQRRVAIESNAETLRLVRRALGRGIALPTTASGVGSYGGIIRRLWALLEVEGDFYANAGDVGRAATVYLDGMELGAVAASGGNWLDHLGTSSVQKYGRADIEKLAPQLNAAQLRASAQRLRAVEARRPPILSLWRAEKQRGLTDLRFYLTDFNRKSLKKFGFSRAQTDELLRLGREKILAQTNERYDEIMRRTQWPFALRVSEPLLATNPFTESVAALPHKLEQSYRYYRASNLLLADALELRAVKLETGAYPETFDASVDPFGTDEFRADSPLIYRRAGESYALYSVGPNGKDENATPIAKGALTELLPGGDIVAPIL